MRHGTRIIQSRVKNPVIRVDADICHGQPCFAGTRIPVYVVLELLEAGVEAREITSKKYFPQLTSEHVHAALHYAAEQFKSREFVAFSSR